MQGVVNNAGTMDSTKGSSVVLAKNGSIVNTGTDDGASLVVTGSAAYTVNGGQTRYDDVTLEGGSIHVDRGAFGVGLTAPVDAATAVFGALSGVRNKRGIITVGYRPTAASLNSGDIWFGADSAFVVDTDSAIDSSKLEGTGSLHVEEGSKLVVAKTRWGRHVLTKGLSTAEAVLDAWSGDKLVNQTRYDVDLSLSGGNLQLNVGRDVDGNGSVDTSVQALSSRFALPGVINGLIDNDSMIERRNVNSEDADISFIERMLDSSFVGSSSDGSLDVPKAAGLWNSALQLSAVSGLDAHALQTTRHVSSAVEEHLRTGSGSNGSAFWVSVERRHDRSDKLESSGAMRGGYEADTYGMTFGVDALRTTDWTVGASFHYEDANLDSLGGYTKTDSDADLFGVEAYAQRRFGSTSLLG